MPKNHATLEHGLASAPHFQIAVDEPEKQQNDDKRDIAVCRGIPELRIVFEGIWKTDKTGSNAYNTVQNVRDDLRTTCLLGCL
jgi:hypothetical protein